MQPKSESRERATISRCLRFGLTALLLSGGLASCKGAVSATNGSSASARTVLEGVVAAQKKYYSDKKQFATSIETLTVSGAEWVSTYRNNVDGHIYRLEVQPKAMFAEANSIQPSMKSLVTGIFVDEKGNTKAILCEAAEAGTAKIAYPTNSITCGAGSTKIWDHVNW